MPVAASCVYSCHADETPQRYNAGMPRDRYVRDKFTRSLVFARELAREYFVLYSRPQELASSNGLKFAHRERIDAGLLTANAQTGRSPQAILQGIIASSSNL
jgi:hypothetical protein